MDIIFSGPGIGLLVILLLLLFWIKSSDSPSVLILFCSLLLIGLTAHFLYRGELIDSFVKILDGQNRYSKFEIENAKHIISFWNLLIPLLLGGLGVSMLNTWVTTSYRQQKEDKKRIEELEKQLSKLSLTTEAQYQEICALLREKNQKE